MRLLRHEGSAHKEALHFEPAIFGDDAMGYVALQPHFLEGGGIEGVL